MLANLMPLLIHSLKTIRGWIRFQHDIVAHTQNDGVGCIRCCQSIHTTPHHTTPPSEGSVTLTRRLAVSGAVPSVWCFVAAVQAVYKLSAKRASIIWLSTHTHSLSHSLTQRALVPLAKLQPTGWLEPPNSSPNIETLSRSLAEPTFYLC